MRIWSISPVYLDKKGLCGLWNEVNLAQKVLKNLTVGYKNHPQLERFKNTDTPVQLIGTYLTSVWEEATHRGYNFDSNLIDYFYYKPLSNIQVTEGQLTFEFYHLQKKLSLRDRKQWLTNHRMFSYSNKIFTHPLFQRIGGKVESWEKTKDLTNVK